MALYLGDIEVAPVIEVPVPETKYGATLDMILGNEPVGDLSFDGVTNIEPYQFAYKFYKSRNGVANREVTIQFPDLQEVKVGGLENMFGSLYGQNYANTRITFLFPKLTKIGSGGFRSFTEQSSGTFPSVGARIIRLDFPMLSDVSGNYAFQAAFQAGSGDGSVLENVSFASLKTISGNRAFEGCFKKQKALKIVSFPSLTTVVSGAFGTYSTNYMFYGCTALTEIHFRADAQAAIEAMTGYADKWGAPASCSILFDL